MQRLDKCDQCKNKAKCSDVGCPEFEPAEESAFQKAFRQLLKGLNWPTTYTNTPWETIAGRFIVTLPAARLFWNRRGEVDKATVQAVFNGEAGHIKCQEHLRMYDA
ncbi:MAG TPA: hypothetical protein ENH62_03090 [Marinobacter sp.]|uniref:Uncharacterized protein n=1 Tax=marine sediment metagenome TaxID=412755 RepID=A0A0F9T838_9ZZZZ|nr:hypothetical protein [Marinobacter sp.]